MISISCGNRDAHTLAMTDDGDVWSWGDGDFGKLGRGGREECLVPKKIDVLCKKNIVQLTCGGQFSLALTAEGLIYAWFVDVERASLHK